ncbi:hypothetical protein DITRI_Ditri01bG0195600 [Diplodiscus trichospermus]
MESRAEMSCELKVNINCETCRKKVMDVLQKLHGVYSVVIDAEKGKVKVSGKVNPYKILKVLEKHGKHGEVSCVKFEGEVWEPIYYHHNYYGGNGHIPYGSAYSYPLMGRPDYYYSWYDRHWYAPTATLPPMATPPLSGPPRTAVPPTSTHLSQPISTAVPPAPRPLSQPPPPPPPRPPAKREFNYFPPKAPLVVAPPKEMNPEWCKIM